MEPDEVDYEAHRREAEARAYPEFTGCIIYCPVCATNFDAEGWGLNEMTCTSCTTVFTVTLVPEVIREHSMLG